MTSERPILFVDSGLRSASVVDGAPLSRLSERHKVVLSPTEPFAIGDVLAAAAQRQAGGIVLTMDRGVPRAAALALMAKALRRGLACYAYWPAEQAIEVLDPIRLKSFRQQYRAHAVLWQLWRAFNIVRTGVRALRLDERYRLLRLAYSLRKPFKRMARGVPGPQAMIDDEQLAADVMLRVDALYENSALAPLPCAGGVPTPARPMPGLGAYLRLDFWVPYSSGGSFGHTCYVARHLAATSERFVAMMARRYQLLDELGVPQLEVSPCPGGASERDLLEANDRYLDSLRTVMSLQKPAYIYERLCLGSFVGAALSQELQIPYIVEYNGSEVSMSRSFGGQGYQFEEIFERIELAVFAQASLISVVSEPIREGLVARGVDASKKILVNPNGAEPDVYAPPAADARAELRAELGFSDEHCVVGFTGTFGGWHGIDVLAEALPRICAAEDSVRFLLVGDGAHKHLVDSAIERYGLAGRCVRVGRVPQQRGAVLLGACDIFVSPHNAHMVDSRFFGSPTKIFEYMSMAGGIVASDLEQIGQVLRPALTPAEFRDAEPEAGNARSVLCEPGDVDDFVDGVLALATRPQLRQALGANARQAIIERFSWRRHVDKLWAFAEDPALHGGDGPMEPDTSETDLVLIETGDTYKDEVQRQWNVDACGGQYVHGIRPDSLQWYLEAERYRYQEYGPWMPETMEFAGHAGEQVLEVGGGMGTDLAQFARHGAHTTDVDLSAGHLRHARRNFSLRGLGGRFVHQDAEVLPFDDDSFDVVYSNGVIHHTPNTQDVIDEMWRVLRPGGKVIAMVYAEHSWHYWRSLFLGWGITRELLRNFSMGEIMSRGVELSTGGQRPLVKVYTAERLHAMFGRFDDVTVVKRQLTRPELPLVLRGMDAERLGTVIGWNLIVKGRKPRTRC